MDFALDEEQQAVADLAGRILDEQPERDRAWAELAKANLLGLCLPEDVGGSGYGFVEACLLLQRVGWAAADVPLLPTLVSAMAIAEHGSEEQRQRWLPGVVAGEVVLTAAVSGHAIVPYADVAARVLSHDDRDEIVLLDVSISHLVRQQTGSSEPTFGIEGDFQFERLGGRGGWTWLLEHWTAALCALQVGLAERALHMTAEYVAGRQQFERPIGSFQAVGQRIADAYIDVEAMRLTMWSAAWRLAQGLPATEDVVIAKFWASDGGQRVMAAAQHLHGGIGVAMDYPLHRYTLMSKQVELTLGSGTPQLARLGEML
jgi:alkylation response protein AidB-like acyl-CoA dehydrogenase